MEKTLKLQKRMAAGSSWRDCDAEKYIACCAATTGLTEEQVIERLRAGELVRWSGITTGAQCRDANAQSAGGVDPSRTEPSRQVCCRSCGRSGTRGAYPFSTAPATGLCDDCI